MAAAQRGAGCGAALEVPARTLREWLATARATSLYPTDVCGAIAQLSSAQLCALASYGLLPGFPWYPDTDLSVVMRLWGSLTEEQRAAATGPGLDMGSLTDDQRAIMEEGAQIAPGWKGRLRVQQRAAGVLFIFPDGTPEGLQRGFMEPPFPAGPKQPTLLAPDLEWTDSHPTLPSEDALAPQAGATRVPSTTAHESRNSPSLRTPTR